MPDIAATEIGPIKPKVRSFPPTKETPKGPGREEKNLIAFITDNLPQPDKALQFIAEGIKPRLKNFLERLHKKDTFPPFEGIENPLERVKALDEKLQLTSSQIVEEAKETLRLNLRMKKGLENVEIDALLEEEIKKVANSWTISINLSPQALIGILKEGRIKSAWEFPGKHQGRHKVETALGIRAKGTKDDPHPIYGALIDSSYPTDLEQGGAPFYGKIFITLKPEKVKDRVFFATGDTFSFIWSGFDGEITPPEKLQLRFKDAVTMKAVRNLLYPAEDGQTVQDKTMFIETQVLGGVTINDIDKIHIPQLALEEKPEGLISRFTNIFCKNKAKIKESLESFKSSGATPALVYI